MQVRHKHQRSSFLYIRGKKLYFYSLSEMYKTLIYLLNYGVFKVYSITISFCSIGIGFTVLYRINMHNPTVGLNENCHKIHKAQVSPLSFAYHLNNDMSAYPFLKKTYVWLTNQITI